MTLTSEQTQPFRLLVVDDEPMLRSVITDFLEMLGYDQFNVASDGREALEHLRQHPVECMISDIRMPEMQLEELLQIIRDEFPVLNVIATSGYSDFDSAENIFRKGAHDFLGKPLNLGSLETALGWVLLRQGILSDAREHFGAGIEPDPDLASERIEALRQRISSHSEGFQDRLQHCLRIHDLLRRLDTGLDSTEGLTLELAVLLHELGASVQLSQLASLPRDLEANELALVHIHAEIAARLVNSYLGRGDLGTVIAKHPTWTRKGRTFDPNLPVDRMTLWLGVLNTIDGCLQARPDRKPFTLDQLKQHLADLGRGRSLDPVECVLGQWAMVAEHYAA